MLCIFPSRPYTMRRFVYFDSTGCSLVGMNFIYVQNKHVNRLGYFKWWKVVWAILMYYWWSQVTRLSSKSVRLLLYRGSCPFQVGEQTVYPDFVENKVTEGESVKQESAKGRWVDPISHDWWSPVRGFSQTRLSSKLVRLLLYSGSCPFRVGKQTVYPNFVENKVTEGESVEQESAEERWVDRTICRTTQKLCRMEHFSKFIHQEIELNDQKVKRSTIFLICFGWSCIKYNM